jgi:hypothetical protein
MQRVIIAKKKKTVADIQFSFGSPYKPSFILNDIAGGLPAIIVGIAVGIILGSLKAGLIVYVGGFILTLLPSIRLVLLVFKIPRISSSCLDTLFKVCRRLPSMV